MSIERYKGRYWALRDSDGTLICVTVYKRGAEEIMRRLGALISSRYVSAFSPWPAGSTTGRPFPSRPSSRQREGVV